MKWSREKVQQQLSPAYEFSLLCPGKADKDFPQAGAWYAVFQKEIAKGYPESCLGQEDLLPEREELAEQVEALFQEKAGEELARQAAAFWKAYRIKTADKRALAAVKSLVTTGEENPYEAILQQATPENEQWMYAYGVPVTETEKQMMRFWFAYSPRELEEMANVIADAFLHGFLSQGRDRRGRKRVRMYYQLGQEALAQKVFAALKERDLCPVLTPVHVLYPNSQCETDHQWDLSYGMDQELFQAEWEAYQKAVETYRPELTDTCGMIGIDQFGMEPEIIYPHPKALSLSEQERQRLADLNTRKEELESSIVKPSEISFCKVAFPNLLVGEQFPEIFTDYFHLNKEKSEPYELLQQELIRELDPYDFVEIKGYRGNETDLTVALWPVSDLEHQTKFLNCGGDLNIPYGEVFTTPRLKGTNGLLHVEEVCLKGIFYHDLKLVFQDGWVTRVEAKEGEPYVRENLLYPQDQVTMGEFAIGTNTKAYALAQKYGIGDRLPILISEKMGPHVAIGDPCFARSEDAPIHNLYDGKEMVCRENEVTKERGKGSSVYFEKHVDITLPYQKVASLTGVKQDGSRLEVIRDGKFVLEDALGLNDGFKEA